MSELWDLLIVGAGPAGCAAGIAASRAGLKPLMIERRSAGADRPRIAWVGGAGVALCGACGVAADAVGAAEIRGLRLHSADLKKSVEVEEPELSGWLVDRSALDGAMLRAASDAGIEVRHGCAARELQLGEDFATLRTADDTELRARVLIMADGADSPTARLANLASAARAQQQAECVLVEFEARGPQESLDIIVGGDRGALLVTIVRHGKHGSLTILRRDGKVDRAAQSNLIEAAGAAGLVPQVGLGAPVPRPSPAGVALDMDSHVGKRCLLVGDAGGFVAAFSNEGIYPAMMSGWVAAQTVVRALQAPVLQDELATFSAAWRSELADYLRMPNTDLSLLMPLVFSNPQMSKRLARAFLLGQKF